MIRIELPEMPPSLNEIIGWALKHRMVYCNKKKYWKDMMHLITCKYPKLKNKADIYITLTFPTKAKHDRDNYWACFKFCLDGMAFLPDDNSEWVEPHLMPFKYEKGVRKAILEIVERK